MTTSTGLCACECGGRTSLNRHSQPNRYIHGHNRRGTSVGWQEGGYWYFRIDGRNIAFHRWVAEQTLGRPLARDEVVHHVNGDKLDNDPDNVVVLTRAEHQRLHACRPRSRWTSEEKTRARALHKFGLTIQQVSKVLGRPFSSTSRYVCTSAPKMVLHGSRGDHNAAFSCAAERRTPVCRIASATTKPGVASP
jgi:hypothetical protein